MHFVRFVGFGSFGLSVGNSKSGGELTLLETDKCEFRRLFWICSNHVLQVHLAFSVAKNETYGESFNTIKQHDDVG